MPKAKRRTRVKLNDPVYPTRTFTRQAQLFGWAARSEGCGHQAYRCNLCQRTICEMMLGTHWAGHHVLKR